MKKCLITILLTVLFTFTSILSAIASEPIKVIINDNNIEFNTLPIIQNNRILVPVRNIAEALGFKVSWSGETHTIFIKGVNKEIIFNIGVRYVYVNGNKLELDILSTIKDSTTFISIRFISEILGGHVKWEKQTNTVSITSKYLTTKLNNMWIVLDTETGKIYYYDPQKFSFLIITDLKYSIIDNVFLKAENTSKGNILITIKDKYGSPHVFNKIYYVYLHMNNSVTQKATVDYKFRFEKNITFYKDKIILTDGQNVFIIDDNTGKVAQSINLINLGLEEDNYFIEGMGGNYLLVRPNKTGILTLIYLSDNTKVQLYKELLNSYEQEYAETNDAPYRGDHLRFFEEREKTLYFKNESTLFHDENIYTYELR